MGILAGNSVANWHPLTWLVTHAGCGFVWRAGVWAHLTNVLLQAADWVLLFLLFVAATGEAMKSAAVAWLFAVHPLNVEAVAWVAERKTVLCMLFFLARACAYVRHAKKPSIARYAVVMVLFALGLLSKVMVVSLPLALLVMDYWPLQRMNHEREGGFSWKAALKLGVEKLPVGGDVGGARRL